MAKRRSRSRARRSRDKKSKRASSKGRALPVLSEDKQYNIFIICKTKKLFDEKVASLSRSQRKIHSFHYVKAVFLKMNAENFKKTKKLKTRYNTSMKARIRKLGCIYAHRNALRKIVKLKTENNLILEEDATLAHLLPNPPGESTYLGGWIVPKKVTLAGKQKVSVPKLKRGLNEINFDKIKILMTHSYFVKDTETAKTILKVIQSKDPIKNYDIFLNDYEFFHKFYYPAIFVQESHVSDIDGKVNKNEERSRDYDLN